MFDTWFRVRNLLASGRLDPSPVITHKFLLKDYAKGFEKMMERPRKSAKVVLFPDPKEMKYIGSQTNCLTPQKLWFIDK